MRRALVTGITGHLGRELARQLASSHIEVHGITRHAASDEPYWNGAAWLHRADGSTDTLARALARVEPDMVFHLASCYRREHHSKDLVPLAEANIVFGLQLADALRLCGCRQLLLAGSFFENFGVSEDRALNLYAATKQAFEKLIDYYVDAHGFDVTSLVLYEIYSEHDTRAKLMSVIADACAQGKPLNLPQDEFWLDLVHVEDAAAAFLRAASLQEHAKEKIGKRRYCVCSGQDTAISGLVSMFELASGRPLTIRRGEYQQASRNMPRPWRGEVVPGWSPRVTLEDGVSRMLLSRG